MLQRFRNNKDKQKRKGFFLKNGAAVLEQIILNFNGKCNPIRTYSAEELKKATDNFNSSKMLYWGSGYKMYKGVYEDREISVKLIQSISSTFMGHLKFIANDVAFASRMSNHKNVLKLLGCCLETELPILVYEFPVKGHLSNYLNWEARKEQLPFERKLGIATGLANSVAYLHHGLPKTFIHRDLHCGHVFLGQDYVPKLSEFQLSIPIPEGKTHVDVDHVFASSGFMAEEVALRGRYTERSDVYNFGILLCELLIGKRLNLDSWYADGTSREGISNMEDETREAWDEYSVAELWKRHWKAFILQGGNRAQKMECTKLIERCIEKNADERPNMIEVAKALIHIRSIRC